MSLQPVAAATVPSWATTPARLRILIGVCWLVVAILGGAVMSSAAQHKRAVHDIAVDAAPSVGAAHRIKVEIEKLDADIVNEMLVPPEQAGSWSTDFATNRVAIGRHLLAATRSAFGDTENEAIEKIEDSLGKYLMAAQEALDAHRRSETDNALVMYKASFDILENELVAAANQLNEISDQQLEDAYEQQLAHSHAIRMLIGALTCVLVATLLAIQYYVFRRFKRRLSPGLVIATLLALVLGGCTISAFRANARALHVLKVDAYESVDQLLASQAFAYEANSAESRWLLDRAKAAEHETRFHTYVDKLATFKAGGSFEKLHDIVLQRNTIMDSRLAAGDDRITASEAAEHELPVDWASGTLARALENVTFPDPDEPKLDEPTHAAETVRAYGIYYAKDARIRELESTGRHADAVQFCIGNNPGESNWAFNRFDESLTQWIAINEAWLQTYRDAAFKSVERLPWLAPLLSLLIAAAVAFGLRARIREYAR